MARKKAKKKSTLKSKAKKAGRKIKKAAKTDAGRAGIGGGIGALALGPVGAVAGAGIAMATRKKGKGRKKNPDGRTKEERITDEMMLSPGMLARMEKGWRAMNLNGVGRTFKTRKDALSFSKSKANPARAFSLETEVSRGRQKKAKGAAGRVSLASAAASDASRISLSRRLAKVNPNSYIEEIPKLSNKDLAEEAVAIEALIHRAEKHPETSRRMLKDLQFIRAALKKEIKSRRLPNPVSSGMITDKTLAELASNYRKRRRAHMKAVTSPGSSAGDVARSQKRLDDAESQLILYAEVKNMDPEDLLRYMRYADKKTSKAKQKAKRNPSSAKIGERELALVGEIPHLGTLGRYPRATHMWESVYINARVRGFSQKSAAKQAWGAVKQAGYYQDTKGVWRMPRRRFNPGSHPKENPLRKVPKSASAKDARAIISRNIATEIDAGKPQRQAVAISLASARRDAPKLMDKMYGPRPNPYLGDAVTRAKAKKKAEEGAKKKRRKTPPPPPAGRRAHTVPATNPKGTSKKSASKKKATKRDLKKVKQKHEKALEGAAVGSAIGGVAGASVGGPAGAAVGSGAGGYIGAKVATRTPERKRLNDRCQKLWDEYCERPTKKRLRAVFSHLDEMKESTNKQVKDERARCLRAANKEAKRLKLKV